MEKPVVEALETRVAGIPFEIAVQTASGIICDPQQLPQAYVKVLSVGPEVKGIKVGDIIMGPKHGGQTVVHQGTIYRIYDKNEIFGILNDDNIKIDEKPILHTV